MSETAETTTDTPVTLTREDVVASVRLKHGKAKLSDGRTVFFLPARRSRNFAIDGSMYDDDGKLVAGMETRPARFLTGYLCDSDGERMFADTDWETVDAIEDELFSQLWDALRKHLRWDKETKSTEKSDAAKN